MNKDVIYIDVDDDVTAIIGKIKTANEKIVALVPPKRAGTLQSAVNLRLLDRMAKTSKKKLVLITSNAALIALAANAAIPVAKNLHTKPELVPVADASVDESEEIIDGADIPVGEHAKTVKVKDGSTEQARSAAIESINIESEDGVASTKKTGAKKQKTKIPNFDSFRKKLFAASALGLGIIALLVWMFVFAPAATIIVTARTTPAPLSTVVTLAVDGQTSVEDSTLAAIIKEDTREETIDFQATGRRNVGERATGTVEFSTNSISALGTTIPAGTQLTSGSGAAFTTNESVTMTFDNYTGVEVGITAVNRGTNANGASGSMSGAPSSIDSEIVGSTAGGTSDIVTVVSEDDIERARGDLIGRSTDEIREELVASFDDQTKPIAESFAIERGTVSSVPAENAEVGSDGQATLTIETTYRMYGVNSEDLEQFLTESLEAQLVGENQQIYNTGFDNAALSSFRSDDDGMTASLTATGQAGPRIDEAEIKEQVQGKIFGEVQQDLQAIEGVQEVDVQFSYFWVRTVPNNPDRIEIEFQLQDA